MEWWQGLSVMNQWLYVSALFFSLLFVWQILAAFSGLMVDHDVGAGHEGFDASGHDGLDAAAHHPGDTGADAHESLLSFKLVSVRSVMAFFMMFSWASALYVNNGASATAAMVLGLLWGGGGMFGVALIFHLMRKMAETGTRRLSSCLGSMGTVYLNIPPGGEGEVRILVSGVMSVVKARCPGSGESIGQGTPVKVVRMLSANSVEVAPEPAAVE